MQRIHWVVLVGVLTILTLAGCASTATGNRVITTPDRDRGHAYRRWRDGDATHASSPNAYPGTLANKNAYTSLDNRELRTYHGDYVWFEHDDQA